MMIGALWKIKHGYVIESDLGYRLLQVRVRASQKSVSGAET